MIIRPTSKCSGVNVCGLIAKPFQNYFTSTTLAEVGRILKLSRLENRAVSPAPEPEAMELMLQRMYSALLDHLAAHL